MAQFKLARQSMPKIQYPTGMEISVLFILFMNKFLSHSNWLVFFETILALIYIIHLIEFIKFMIKLKKKKKKIIIKKKNQI